MFRTVHSKIIGLILIILVLVASSFITTSIAVQTHRRDETIVALAHEAFHGVQGMTWLALSGASAAEIEAAAGEYGRYLGQVHDVVGGPDESASFLRTEDIRLGVDSFDEVWRTYQSNLKTVSELSMEDPLRAQAAQDLRLETLNLFGRISNLSRALESYSDSKHVLLLRIQVVFLATTVLFTALGYLLIRQRIVRPLSILTRSAQQITQHAVQEPLNISGDDEIGHLARSFEQMRTAILANQAELEKRIYERTSEIATAFEFSQEIVSQRDLDHLIDSVTNKTRILMRAKDATLCLVTPDGCAVKIASTTGTKSVGEKEIQPIRTDPSDFAVMHQQPIIVPVSKLGCAFLQRSPEDQSLSAPLRIGEQLIGAICVVRDKDEPFQEEESVAFSLLTNSAAIAIANARYAEEAREREKQAAASAERERLASELHNNLVQTLSLVNLRIGYIQEMFREPTTWAVQAEIELLRTNVEQAVEQVRVMMSELAAPAQRNEDTLSSQLGQVVKEFEQATGIPVEVTGLEAVADQLAILTQKQVVMIIGEALINIRRHAEARNVAIRFRIEHDNVCLTIEDDGKGFQVKTLHGTDHLGLRIMRARTERSGGTFRIDSAAGQGTKVTASFPIDRVNLK